MLRKPITVEEDDDDEHFISIKTIGLQLNNNKNNVNNSK
jgi:hypothetical protein